MIFSKEENSQPLKKYALEIDNLKLSSKIIKGKRITFYDPRLEQRLYQIVREIGILINYYYMPKKEYDEDEY